MRQADPSSSRGVVTPRKAPPDVTVLPRDAPHPVLLACGLAPPATSGALPRSADAAAGPGPGPESC